MVLSFRGITQIQHTPKRPDSGRSDTGQSDQASRAGRFADTRENMQLHSLLHIKVL